jgi:hypothetical protein
MFDTLRGSIEENVLTVLCTSEQYAMRVALQAPPELYSNPHYKKIAGVAIDYLYRMQKPIGPHLRDVLEQDLRPATQEAALLGSYIQAMEALAPNLHVDYVLEELDNFTELRRLTQTIAAASDAANAGDLAKTREIWFGASSIGKSPKGGIWLSDPQAMLGFLDAKSDEYFPTGIKELDTAGVRPNRKQLFMIIGSKGIGKSWWLINFGKHAIMHRRSVLHITLELDEQLTAQRYIQALYTYSTPEVNSIRVPVFRRDPLNRFSSLEFETRVPDKLNNEARAKLAERLKLMQHKAPMLIKEFPSGGLTVSELMQYLLFLEREHKFRPDLLILDQAFNLRFDRREIRLSMGQEVLALRGLAIERNMAIVTSWQGNRQTDTAKTVTSSMIAEDWSLGGTSDVICTISRTRQEQENKTARILVDKARTARDKFSVMIAQSYETGQFCLESDYMNNRYNEEIERLSGKSAA